MGLTLVPLTPVYAPPNTTIFSALRAMHLAKLVAAPSPPARGGRAPNSLLNTRRRRQASWASISQASMLAYTRYRNTSLKKLEDFTRYREKKVINLAFAWHLWLRAGQEISLGFHAALP